MSSILFDIGANWGTDSLTKTEKDPNIVTYAFEPTPELVHHLTVKSQSFSERYKIFPIALSDFDGTAKFNIADHFDWGCSSLNDFNDNLESFWPGRPDFKFNRSLDVSVYRLDTWFEKNQIHIEKIDFFHCDTQGSDLKVLQGMGKYIDLIREGVIECARDSNSKLYKQNHTLLEAREFLESKGFVITNLRPNDHFHNEINLYFKKP